MYEQIAANKRRTVVLVAVFVLVLAAAGAAAGYLLGFGWYGVIIAFVVSGVLAFASYWKSAAVALSVSRAHPADPNEYKRLYNLVEGLCIAGGLPQPRIYIVDDEAPNAFATGRNPRHAAIAVTTGLLEKMNRVELEGVLAHELSHVKNRDVLISTIAATLAGAITYLAHMAQWAAMFGGRSSSDDEGGVNPIAAILMAILAPIAAMLVQMAVSRSREYQADATGARIAGKPWGLAKALEKLQMAQQVAPMEANPATAHLFIVNPLSGRSLMNLFSTHPPLEDRIARLRAMRPS